MSKGSQKMIGKNTSIEYRVGSDNTVKCDFTNPNETIVPLELGLEDSTAFSYYDAIRKIHGDDWKGKLGEYNEKIKEIKKKYNEKGEEILELFNNILYAETESMANEIEQLFKEYTSKDQGS